MILYSLANRIRLCFYLDKCVDRPIIGLSLILKQIVYGELNDKKVLLVNSD